MIGKTISHYKILDKIGEGGVGVVYKARDTKLDRTVALKFLLPGNAGEQSLKQSLLDEARAAATLNHPNIATIYAIEEIRNDFFMAMEYIEGKVLKDIILPESLSLEKIIDIGLQLCDGLQAAHDASIIHRDLKPANIMLTDRGLVKIMDFGLADIRHTSDQPQINTTAGTVSFMSPEQINGDPVDYKSDIWALGVILYQMVTGRLPFHYEFESALIYSILNESPIPPVELNENIPDELERLILICLRKESSRRYSSVREIRNELSEIDRKLKSDNAERLLDKNYRLQKQKEVERKRATILFANISGYSELMTEAGHEELVSLLPKWYEMVESAARQFDGTVNRITEHTMRLLFGLPEAIENSTTKALNAALLIRDQFEQYKKNAGINPDIGIRMGIYTGIVLAGTTSSSEDMVYNVIGEPVDLSYALMDKAALGEIVAGSNTCKETENEFRFGEVRRTKVKGKQGSIKYFELLGSHDTGDDGHRVSKKIFKSGIVGRDKELTQLEMNLLKATYGEGSIITISGEPGIGKSRLIEEFKKRATQSEVRILEGRTVSYGKNLSFHPIIEILKNWAMIRDEDDETAIISKLKNTISNIYSGGIQDILPLISNIMGIRLKDEYGTRIKDITGEALVKLTQKNIRDLIIKESEQTPVVFIVEDIHWADRSSLDLIQSLLRLCVDQRIVFVFTLRPDYEESGERILDGIRDRYYSRHYEINLEPLSEQETAKLIGNYIDMTQLPVTIRGLITVRSLGNPYFIEEVIQSFIDEGVLEYDNGGVSVSRRVDRLSIPETIQDMLAARVDRLNENTKSVLKVASVIGRLFNRNILEETVDPNIHVYEHLDVLEKLRLINKDRVTGESEYQFKHALLHEVVYDSIPYNRRKEIHMRVARAVEKEYADRLPEYYGVLAYHYSSAGEPTKSEEYLLKAGELTLKTAASHEALHYFQEALKLYLKSAGDKADKEKIARLEMNIGIALQNKGHLVDSVVHFENALEHLGQKIYRTTFRQNAHLLRDVLGLLRKVYIPLRRKKNPPAERDVTIFYLRHRKANALANFAPHSAFMDLFGAIRSYLSFRITNKEACEVYAIAASLFSFSGISFSIGAKFLRKAKQFKHDDVRALLLLKFLEKLHNALSGNWKDSYPVDEELVESALYKGEFYFTTNYLSWSLYIILASGDFTYGRRLMQLQKTISDAFDFEYGRLWKRHFDMNLNMKMRNYPEAINAADECCVIAETISLYTWKIGLLGQKAEAQIYSGDIEGARDTLHRAEDYLAEAGRVAPMLRCHYIRSRFIYDVYIYEQVLKTSSGDYSRRELKKLRSNAYKSGREAISISQYVAEMKTASLMIMGRLLWIDGAHKKSMKYWNESIATGKSLGARYELSQTYFEIGKRLLQSGDYHNQLSSDTPDEYFAKARQLFEAMDLQEDLSLLNEIQSLKP